MTVAPELPPASAARRREAEPQAAPEVAPPARAARRSPFGAATHTTARSGSPARVDRPTPRRSPEETGPAALSDRELAELVGLPELDRGRRRGTVVEPPGEGVGRERRPATPVRLPPVDLRPVGARVVRPARPGPRLTRRGRVVAGMVALLVTVTTLLAVTERVEVLQQPASVVPATAPAEVVVAPGETLWSIAERVAPDRDPRIVVDQIRRINDLPSGDVQAGQTLRLRVP
jgi:hypothetical protein